MTRLGTVAALLLMLLGSTVAAQEVQFKLVKPCQPWPACAKPDPDKPPVINPGLPGDPGTPGIKEDRLGRPGLNTLQQRGPVR